MPTKDQRGKTENKNGRQSASPTTNFMTRLGKIARLPRTLREQLNARLHNGEMGKRLLAWLNAEPEARSVLAEKFGGRPINDQNLSEWKRGGFADWLRQQEVRQWVQCLREVSEELEEDAGAYSVADWLSAPLAVALGRWMHLAAQGAPRDPQERAALLGVARELTLLRRGDHTEQRLRLARERWEAQQVEATAGARRAEALAPFRALISASLSIPPYGNGGKAPEPPPPPQVQAVWTAMATKPAVKNGPNHSPRPNEPPAGST